LTHVKGSFSIIVLFALQKQRQNSTVPQLICPFKLFASPVTLYYSILIISHQEAKNLDINNRNHGRTARSYFSYHRAQRLSSSLPYIKIYRGRPRLTNRLRSSPARVFAANPSHSYSQFKRKPKKWTAAK
jgi:hypothetical protein